MRKNLLRPGSGKACLCLLVLALEIAEPVVAVVMGGLLISTLLKWCGLPAPCDWFERDEPAEVEV